MRRLGKWARCVRTLKIFSFVAAAGLFAACSNLGDDYSGLQMAPILPGVASGGQSEGESSGASIENCLTASVSLPGLPSLAGIAPVPKNVAQNISKSAFPNIADATDPSYSFSATLAQSGGATYSADGTYDSVTGICSFAFAGAKSASEANYTITVSLWHTDGTPAVKSLVASGSQDVTVAAGGGAFDASVSLAPNLESGAPNGSLSLPINFSDTSVTSVGVTLIDKDGTDVTTACLGGSTVTLTGGSGTITSVAGGLPAGPYTLLMSFMKGTAMVGSRKETLNVFPSMQTCLWWTKDGLGTAATALSVTNFAQKEFYVRGTGGVFYTTTFPGAGSALDENNGSFAFPLKTIQEAVNRIVASGDTTSLFTVYIDGKIEGDPDADYSSNQSSLVRLGSSGVPFENKILIKGWTGPDTDIIDVKKSKDSANKGRAFYIKSASSAKVIVKDLGITHSAASGIGGAFYIISCSDAILENCKISECYAQTSGGGIYMSQSNLELKNSVVSQNEAAGSGGGVYVQGGDSTAKGCLTIEKSEVSANSAASGGGVYVNVFSTLNFLSGQIAANTANYSSTVTNSGLGGGVYINSSGKCFISGAATIGQSLASTSSCATSADGSHSNKATQGGGIYNKGELYLGYTDDSTPAAWTGSVCYNYASSDGGGILSYGSSTLVKMNAGSVAYNLCSDGSGTTGGGGGVAVQNSSAFTMSGGTVSYNQTNNKVGGGIYVDSGATLTLSGTAEVSSNKTSPDGTGSMGGAGLFAYRASITMEGNAVVKDNLCKDCGGGVYLFEFENASSYASLAMSGNAKILENTSSDGLGGAVYVVQRCSFSMSGAATIPAGVAGTTGAGKNDVYLDEDTSVAVPAAITSTATPVATITPKSPYAVDTTVLTGAALSAAQCAKFAVTQPAGAVGSWSIKFDSVTTKGVLKQLSIVYVSSPTLDPSSSVPAGSDSGDGSIEHPYATFYKAAQAFSEKAPAIGGTAAAPEFENKIYLLSDLTYTTGAGLDGENAYNVEIIGCKDGVVGDKVKLILNTPTHDNSGFYVNQKHKIKFTNIDITQTDTSQPNDYAAVMVGKDSSNTGECWLEDCSIKNMVAKNCSAIAAEGDVYLKNVTITGNTTKVEIAPSATMIHGPAVYSKTGTVHIAGKIVVKDNTVDFTTSDASLTGSKVQNLWIGENTGVAPAFHPLDILGVLTGSDIGVTLYDNTKTFTQYFSSSGSSNPADFFTSDDGWSVVKDSGNAKLGPATDLYVSASGNDTTGNGTSAYPYATVQKAAEKIQAFNSATTEYTVHVAGTVVESAVIDDGGAGAKFVGSKLTIDGSGTEPGILDGGGSQNIMTLSLSAPVEFKNLTFQNGKVTSGGGAALDLDGTAAYTITDCVFTGNSATNSTNGNGGAIFVGADASLFVGSSTSGSTNFTLNYAQNGGAIYNEGKCFIYGSTVIGNKDAGSYAQEATTMHSNSANYGGGIYNKGQLYLGYSSWTSPSVNTAADLTGGVYYNYAVVGGGIFNDSSSSVVVNSGNISKNGTSTTGIGGGLFNQGTLDITGGSVDNNFGGKMGGGILVNAATTISGTATISENSATDGAGVYIFQNKLTMNGGSVSSNIADQTGGGIYVNPGPDTDKGIFEFNDGTISQNLAIQGAGVADLGVMNMAGGTISQNQADGAAGAACGGGLLVNSVQTAPFTMTGGSIEGNSSEGSGGGLYIFNGECSMSNGTISGNTAALYGGGIFVDQGKITNGATTTTYKGQLNLSGDATIPPGTEGKNDIALFNSLDGAYSENSIKVTGALSASNVAKIIPGIYGSGVKVLDGTAALVSASHSKFTVADYVDGGVTTKWAVGPTGYLNEIVSGGGTIVIHTPEGDLNLAASATTIATSASSTTVKITATDASGDPITTGLTWNGVTVYYGTEEIDSKADTNSYKFSRKFPKGTYTLNVSVTYKGTTYSDSFTIKKTVDGAVAAAMPDDFKKITAGTMKRAKSIAGPIYIATISKDYYMCEHEVTQKEWKDVMGNTQANLTSAAGGTSIGIGDNYPVYYVNWYHAIAYCNKRSIADGLDCVYEVEGVDFETLVFADIPTDSDPTWDAVTCDWSADGYRLPTETEWQYAAIGTYKDNANWNGVYNTAKGWDELVFAGYNGSNWANRGEYAWCGNNSSDKTHPVKQKLPNSNDMCDMTGNVSEWCWDWFNDDQYATDGNITDPKGPATGEKRAIRGSTLYSEVTGVGARGSIEPWQRDDCWGFRVVRNAP